VEATEVEATEVEATEVEATEVEATEVETAEVERVEVETVEVETVEVEATARVADPVPAAQDDAFTMRDDQQLGANVLHNDAAAAEPAAGTAVVEGPQHGRLVLHDNGLFTYIPERGFSGTDTFTYRVGGAQDAQPGDVQAAPGEGQTVTGAVGTVTIVVEASNHAPEAAADEYSVDEDQTLMVETDGALQNDTDVDGDTLSAVLIGAPAHGTVMLNEDGLFEYTPHADFHGNDSFVYAAHDGFEDSAATTVSITVNAVNDAPIAADDSYTAQEDEALVVQATGVLANDTDGDGDALSAVVVDEPQHGAIALAADGSFTYTPDPDFHGDDQFTYLVNDGSADSNIATVAVAVQSVNDAPVAAADAYATREGETLAIDASGVLGNDTDVDGDALTAMIVDQPQHGSVSLAADGSFTYTPEENFHGTDSFTYTAGDGQADSEPATVEITVTPIDLSIQLEVSQEAFADPAESLWAGSTFWVSAYVQDLRDIPLGVVGGAIDILFDAGSVAPTGNVAYGEAFNAFQQGQADPENGQIDEAGAISTAVGVGVDAPAAFVAWEFVSLLQPGDGQANPHLQFRVDFGEGTETVMPAEFALIGSGDPVAAERIATRDAEVDLYFADFNVDGAVNHFDLALWQPHAGAAADSPDYDPSYDLNADQAIDGLDLDLLTAVMYRPTTWTSAAADASSEATVETELETGDGASDELI
jgi:VCBS repeat-containing protein